MLHRDYLFSKCAKFSEKIALLTPWSGLRNVSFSGNFVHFLNRWSHGRTMEVLCPMCCEKMSLPELIVLPELTFTSQNALVPVKVCLQQMWENWVGFSRVSKASLLWPQWGSMLVDEVKRGSIPASQRLNENIESKIKAWFNKELLNVLLLLRWSFSLYSSLFHY